MSAAEPVRALYRAFAAGDVPAAMAVLAEDVIVDEPAGLPYGGIHRGRDAFVADVLGPMLRLAQLSIDDAIVLGEGETAMARVRGTLTPRAAGESFALSLVEVHTVRDGLIRHIDVHVKDTGSLAAFYDTQEEAR